MYIEKGMFCLLASMAHYFRWNNLSEDFARGFCCRAAAAEPFTFADNIPEGRLSNILNAVLNRNLPGLAKRDVIVGLYTVYLLHRVLWKVGIYTTLTTGAKRGKTQCVA